MGDEASFIVCKSVELPLERLVQSMMTARAINPANCEEVVLERARALVDRTNLAIAKVKASPLSPFERRIAIARLKATANIDSLTMDRGRRWAKEGGTFTVKFIDNESQALRKKILSHMNVWTECANVVFVETDTDPLVRVARFDAASDPTDNKGGYWSYVGTDILDAKESHPTLNLQGFTVDTAESEFKRVVRHEAGHTLGFLHEHLLQELIDRLDEQRVIDEYERMHGWTEAYTRAHVLTPLEEASIMGTSHSDQDSIMCYPVEPYLTLDGQGIRGGEDLTDKDREFAETCYPPVA